jgi:hypothetical protein
MARMVQWYESSIDRQLREATERGEFENLAGAGKPLPDHGRDYDEDWWVKDWLEREVRDYVTELNERIHKARVGLMDGPPVVLPALDADEVVAGWRERRG